MFIYSGSDRLVSFEIKLISKEVSRAEYMNIHPPPPNYLHMESGQSLHLVVKFHRLIFFHCFYKFHVCCH